ncbi:MULTISPECIES: Gfo/Idh/MocA family protein [unclassified Haladaptatus]|uniref:Gfo/Idh/MocA family protein n=1 Tax=unclassified Haladaptatus TaxID=2622732 RepID=UPI0023E78AF4|nr:MULTISPECIES: Gfo/Idh/MocA family oxidoreductase [unclassified Haladaptatus]
MPSTRVGIIGTGPAPDETRDDKGYSMGYRHAHAYRAVEGCHVVGCADIDAENAAAFADEFDLPESAVFTDHAELLASMDVDLVSICTPPQTHEPLVEDCLASDAVGAIHCEKPIAPTWGACKRIVEACRQADVALTFNFQNRGRPAVKAVKNLLDSGDLGRLERVEVSRADLMQTGIHNIDLANYFAGDTPVSWVLGQVDYRTENVWYTDMHSEDQGLALWMYDSGVSGLAATGEHASEVLGPQLRLLTSEARVEIRFWEDPTVRVLHCDNGGWKALDVPPMNGQQVALRDVVESYRSGTPSSLRAENGMRATELVFAVWESAKRRGRIDLPLETEGNALAELVESGERQLQSPSHSR